MNTGIQEYQGYIIRTPSAFSDGCVLRWGDPWFEAIRDGWHDGTGWSFRKHDKPAIEERAEFLLDFLSRSRGNGEQMLAIGQGEQLLAIEF